MEGAPAEVVAHLERLGKIIPVMKTYQIFLTTTDYQRGTLHGRLSQSDVFAGVAAGTIPADAVVVEDGLFSGAICKARELSGCPPSPAMIRKQEMKGDQEAPNDSLSALPSSATRRYCDAYLLARATTAIGDAVKGIGVAIGGLILVVAVVIGTQSGSIVNFVLGGTLVGVIVGLPIYLLGVLVSAHGEVLKATLDAAVHS